MRRFAVLAAVLVGLASCDMPRAGSPAGAATPAAPVAAPVALAPSGPINLPGTPRAQARAFVEVVDAVEPVAESVCRARAPQLNCDFQIVIDDNPNAPINAFQTVDDNGRPIVGFTLAMIADARNRDELAFVLAHEAAHHIEDHLSEQQRLATTGAIVFGQLAGALGRSADDIRIAQEVGAAVGARTYSREFELEADRLGTIITARAGFDPVRGADFFFRVPDPGDTFLATHPPNAERIQLVRETAAGL
ncbi:MAG: M48 family metallopeptidase [Pseudomonadota bacterium]